MRMNPREANILEEARLRKVAIQNMQRDNFINHAQRPTSKDHHRRDTG